MASTQTLLVNTRPGGRVHLPDCPWLANVKVPGHGPLPAHYKMIAASDVPADKPRCSYCLKTTVV